MADLHLIAVDLGASGGRVILARLSRDGCKLTLDEAHRFEHRPIHVPDVADAGAWCWDVLELWEQVKRGLALAAQRAPRIDGIGIDSWGVDYALVDRRGRLVRPPVAYRDPRTDFTYPRVLQTLRRETIYARTGIQFMPLNTLYQLAADAADPDRPLDRTSALLMLPQLLAFWLTGAQVAEHTLASTTQMYDAVKRAWITEFTDAIGAPASILPDPVDCDRVIGTLRPAVAEELNLDVKTPVIAVGSHDTASAVVAAPLCQPTSAYLSSGTWSLLGLELDAPLRTPEALAANLTNEAGVAGTTRLLKNVTGLWLVQECRRVWNERGNELTYPQLADLAAAAAPSDKLIDPNDPAFTAPGDMPARIRAATGLRDEPGPIIRCILDSLAAGYADVLQQLGRAAQRAITSLHIVGGGGHNTLLNQLTADATRLPVTVGPLEATAIGNALVQAMALGALSDLTEARRVVAASFSVTAVDPRP